MSGNFDGHAKKRMFCTRPARVLTASLTIDNSMTVEYLDAIGVSVNAEFHFVLPDTVEPTEQNPDGLVLETRAGKIYAAGDLVLIWEFIDCDKFATEEECKEAYWSANMDPPYDDIPAPVVFAHIPDYEGDLRYTETTEELVLVPTVPAIMPKTKGLIFSGEALGYSGDGQTEPKDMYFAIEYEVTDPVENSGLRAWDLFQHARGDFDEAEVLYPKALDYYDHVSTDIFQNTFVPTTTGAYNGHGFKMRHCPSPTYVVDDVVYQGASVGLVNQHIDDEDYYEESMTLVFFHDAALSPYTICVAPLADASCTVHTLPGTTATGPTRGNLIDYWVSQQDIAQIYTKTPHSGSHPYPYWLYSDNNHFGCVSARVNSDLTASLGIYQGTFSSIDGGKTVTNIVNGIGSLPYEFKYNLAEYFSPNGYDYNILDDTSEAEPVETILMYDGTTYLYGSMTYYRYTQTEMGSEGEEVQFSLKFYHGTNGDTNLLIAEDKVVCLSGPHDESTTWIDGMIVTEIYFLHIDLQNGVYLFYEYKVEVLNGYTDTRYTVVLKLARLEAGVMVVRDIFTEVHTEDYSTHSSAYWHAMVWGDDGQELSPSNSPLGINQTTRFTLPHLGKWDGGLFYSIPFPNSFTGWKIGTVYPTWTGVSGAYENINFLRQLRHYAADYSRPMVILKYNDQDWMIDAIGGFTQNHYRFGSFADWDSGAIKNLTDMSSYRTTI